MTDCLAIRLPAALQGAGGVAEWCVCNAGGQYLRHGASSLRQIADEVLREGTPPRVAVLLPGDAVLVRKVALARSHAKHLHDAAAFALEEQLAEFPEEAHIALGGELAAVSAGEAAYAVAVIDEALMQSLMQSLAEAGIAPDLVTSEALLISHQDGAATLLYDRGRVLFRLSAADAGCLEAGLFLTFFESYLEGVSQKPARLALWAENAQSEACVAFLTRLTALCQNHGLSFDMESLKEHTLSWLCRGLAAAPEPINLLQGKYRARRSVRFSLPHKKAVAAVVAVWAAGQAILAFGAALYLDSKTVTIRAENLSLYREWVPGGGNVADLNIEMMQASQNGAVALLAALASASGGATPDIDTLRYDATEGTLTVEIAADIAPLADDDPVFAVETNERTVTVRRRQP